MQPELFEVACTTLLKHCCPRYFSVKFSMLFRKGMHSELAHNNVYFTGRHVDLNKNATKDNRNGPDQHPNSINRLQKQWWATLNETNAIQKWPARVLSNVIMVDIFPHYRYTFKFKLSKYNHTGQKYHQCSRYSYKSITVLSSIRRTIRRACHPISSMVFAEVGLLEHGIYSWLVLCWLQCGTAQV